MPQTKARSHIADEQQWRSARAQMATALERERSKSHAKKLAADPRAVLDTNAQPGAVITGSIGALPAITLPYDPNDQAAREATVPLNGTFPFTDGGVPAIPFTEPITGTTVNAYVIVVKEGKPDQEKLLVYKHNGTTGGVANVIRMWNTVPADGQTYAHAAGTTAKSDYPMTNNTVTIPTGERHTYKGDVSPNPLSADTPDYGSIGAAGTLTLANPNEFPIYATPDEPATIVVNRGEPNEEKMLLIGGSGQTLQVLRMWDMLPETGVSYAHAAGEEVWHVIAAWDIDTSNLHQGRRQAVHGVWGDVVGTTDPQVLWNKVLVDPVIVPSPAASQPYVALIGDGTNAKYTVTHALGTADINVDLYARIDDPVVVTAGAISGSGLQAGQKVEAVVSPNAADPLNAIDIEFVGRRFYDQDPANPLAYIQIGALPSDPSDPTGATGSVKVLVTT